MPFWHRVGTWYGYRNFRPPAISARKYFAEKSTPVTHTLHREGTMRCNAGFSISILFFFTALLLPHPLQSGQTTAAEPRADKTPSPYFFIEGSSDEEMLPLKSTGANVTISGVIADVEIRQVYKNEGKKRLKRSTSFPVQPGQPFIRWR